MMHELDDPQLLKLMMDDTEQAPHLYKPTNYWHVYAQRFLPELQRLGLRDFRRRKNSILASFGATDLRFDCYVDPFQIRLIHNRITRAVPFWLSLLSVLKTVLNWVLPVWCPSILDFWRRSYETARFQGEQAGAKPVTSFQASEVGNPEDLFEIEGQTYMGPSLATGRRLGRCPAAPRHRRRTGDMCPGRPG